MRTRTYSPKYAAFFLSHSLHLACVCIISFFLHSFTYEFNRSAAELKPCLESFHAAVARDPERGACFFAVCRGKVSEGLDFADAQARLVILTGIPYAPAMDPKVCFEIMCAQVLDFFPFKYVRPRDCYVQLSAKQLTPAKGWQ